MPLSALLEPKRTQGHPMELGQVILILNPAARAGRATRLWGFWIAALRSAGTRVVCVETTSLADATNAARSAAPESTAVVAVGGDGTINAVLNGLLSRADSAPPLGVLYAGTSPDFCRFHGIPVEPGEAVRALISGRPRAVDAVRLDYADPSGAAQTACFACSANLGIGAVVADRANRWRPRLGDALGTGLAVLSALGRRHADLDVSLDGGPRIRLHQCCHLAIAKNPFIASGLRFAGDLRPDDGRLAVMGVHGCSPLRLLGLLPKFYTGTISRSPRVHFAYARRVTVSASTAVGVEFDGDPRGALPVRAEVLPACYRLILAHTHE